jgi:hypothetical protein
MGWICGIYERRPEVCKKYPESGSYLPPSCGFFFGGDGIQRGKCVPECDSACCKLPRLNGEPGGVPMFEIAGGMSCKYLEYTEVPRSEPKEETTISPGVPSEQPDDMRELE